MFLVSWREWLLDVWRMLTWPLHYLLLCRDHVLYAHDWQWVHSEQRYCCMSCGQTCDPGDLATLGAMRCPVRCGDDGKDP